MISVRKSSGDKGTDVFTFEKSGSDGENILVLTRGIKGWTLELPKTSIVETSSNMTRLQELAEALSKVVQLVESDGYNASSLRMLPAKSQPQISTVGTAVKSAPAKVAVPETPAKKKGRPAKSV